MTGTAVALTNFRRLVCLLRAEGVADDFCHFVFTALRRRHAERGSAGAAGNGSPLYRTAIRLLSIDRILAAGAAVVK